MIIIPGMDITNKKVTGLANNVSWSQDVPINRNPIDVAEYWKSKGAKRLYVADLDGANNGVLQNIDVVKEIIDKVGIRIILGGGIRNEKIADDIFKIGVEKIVLGTQVALDYEFAERMVAKYKEKIVVSLGNLNGYVAIHDWSARTEETIFEFFERMKKIGCKYIVYNDVDRKGGKGGPNTYMIKYLKRQFPRQIIIIGCGISSLKDIEKLRELKVDAAIMVTALYTQTVDYSEAVKVGDPTLWK